MAQRDSEHHDQASWAHRVHAAPLGDEGPRALAILLTAGWSALATLAQSNEDSAILGRHLEESLGRLREEITRFVELIESLLDWARHWLLSDWLLQSPAAHFAHHPYLNPILGPLQKEQTNLDTLQRALTDYETAAWHHVHKLGELFEAALNEYQWERSADVPLETGARTARELNDRWIQIAERTYERFLSSEDHARSIAGLINAWTELQLALRPIVDEVLRHMGLPSRRDTDATQAYLERLRRQQRSERARLEREIAALWEELAAVRGDASEPPSNSHSSKGNPS